MLITTQNEIISLMPTARWDRPQQLFGYLEEENIWTKPKKVTKAVDLPEEDDHDNEKPSKATSTPPRPENKGGSYGGGKSGGGGATIKW